MASGNPGAVQREVGDNPLQLGILFLKLRVSRTVISVIRGQGFQEFRDRDSTNSRTVVTIGFWECRSGKVPSQAEFERECQRKQA